MSNFIKTKMATIIIWLVLIIVPIAYGALSTTKTWVNDETLTHTDLNASINNILNNALSLISPLTGNLDCNSKELQNLILEKLGADGTGAEGQVIYNTTDDHAKLYNDSGYQFLVDVPDAGSANEMLQTDGTDFDWVGDPVVKAWGHFYGTATPGWRDNFNMDTTITDNNTGDYSVTFTTDFADAYFACVATSNQFSTQLTAYATTGIQVQTFDSGASPADAADISLIAIGDQS